MVVVVLCGVVRWIVVICGGGCGAVWNVVHSGGDGAP